MTFQKIVAFVPMRHTSVRVPGKNYRLIAGKPLFHHILGSLSACPEIAQIVVDTDSPTVAEGLSEFFPKVRVLERPEHLRADTVPMNEILMYDTGQVEGDLYLQTHSTNPLLSSATISAAIQTLQANYPAYDSLFTVTPVQRRLWDALARPINHNPAILLRTQDLPPVYEENSCIYLFTRETLVTKRNRIGERPYLFPMTAIESWDIDNEEDFVIADALLSRRLDRGL